MTAETLDIEALHATLDGDPADQLTRRVLADAYEDAGVLWMADGLRRMADAGARPDFAPDWDCVAPWHWRREDGAGDYAAHDIPPAVWLAMPNDRKHGFVKRFTTRRDAEEALCRSLAKEASR